MSIAGISGTLPPFVSGQMQPIAKPEVASGDGTGFADRVSGALRDVAESQNKAAGSAKAYEMGLTDDLASVMVDQQVSSLGFQMALNVRNKALGAYRDIMNMPV